MFAHGFGIMEFYLVFGCVFGRSFFINDFLERLKNLIYICRCEDHGKPQHEARQG